MGTKARAAADARVRRDRGAAEPAALLAESARSRRRVSIRVLLAGTFDPEFARNRVLISLLEREGFEVDVARRELWGRDRRLLIQESKWGLIRRALRTYPSLVAQLARAKRPDVILVPYPGHVDVPFI